MLRSVNSRAKGFSLVELLAATSVALLLVAILMGLSGQVSRLQVLGLTETQRHYNTRVALNFMAREIRQSVLSRDSSTSSANRLQFLINPSGLNSSYSNHDSVFWQAPIATTTQAGDLAEVGYFVAWQGTQANLCRFFVNPDSTDYMIYSNPTQWVTNDLLSEFAPGSSDQGLFLENVIGLWVDAFATGDAGAASINSWDSTVSKKLPARVTISLVVLDSVVAKRLTAPVSVASYGSAESCVANLPPLIRAGASVVTFSVALDNYQ
jgi:Tfp pilus assembly protein PilV